MPNGTCYLHGGATPSGSASPHFKHGRYSKNIPTRLAARYNEARADSELTELREDLALLDARLEDLLGRVDTGESGAMWSSLQKSVIDYYNAQEKERDIRLSAVFALIERGVADHASWMDVRSTLEQRRKTAETEHKRLVAMQQMVTAEQAMTLAAGLLAAVKSHVTDRSALAAIGDEFIRLTSRPDLSRTNAGGSSPGLSA